MRSETVMVVLLVLLYSKFSSIIAERRNGFKWVHQCERGKNNLKPLVEKLVEEIAMRSKCIVFITDPSYRRLVDVDANERVYFIPRYDISLRDNEEFSQPRRPIKSILREVKAAGCDAYVILIANGLLLSRFLQYVERERLVDTRGCFLLLYDDRLFRPELHYIWNRIINVVFIRRYHTHTLRSGQLNADEHIDLSTVYYPSRRGDFIELKYIDTWYQGRLRYDSDHYISKTANLHGNGVRVAIFEHIPTVTEASRNYYHQNTNASAKALGIEFELLRVIAKAMNFKANYYTPSNIANERWGRIGDNDTYTGLLGEAIAGNADFILGDLHYTLNHLKHLDLSTSYNTECLTFLTPEALTDNSWKLLIRPFSLYAWLALFFSLLLGAGMVYLFALFYQKYISPCISKDERNDNASGLSMFTNFPNSLLYTYSMLLQVSLPSIPKTWALRIFIGWWWIYTILITVMYRASMTATLAHPFARMTIDTLAQLTKSSLAVGGWSEDSKDFFLASSDPNSQEIGSKFQLTDNEEQAIEQVANGTFGYYENSYFLRHMRALQISENSEQKNKSEEHVGVTYNLHIMEECVVYMPIALGLEKNSPLKPHVDLLVGRMTEIGLVDKWLSDVMEWSKIIETRQKSDSTTALVTLRNLYGAFVALGIGYFISLVALIGEILYWKCVVLKDPKYDKYQLDKFYKSGNKSET